MTDTALIDAVNAAWEVRDTLSPDTTGEARDAITTALNRLDTGEARVATPGADGQWQVHEWLKKAVLLSFRLNPMRRFPADASGTDTLPMAAAWDKVPLKTGGWGEDEFVKAGFRNVPGAIVRHGAHVAPGAVLMPSFVNIGAYVGAGTMVDTWATVGSCAQIGSNVHISGGAGIGGVLEPLQASPVIIEDNCFIGARSEVAEGVIVREGAVLAMGVFLSKSTKIIDRATGAVRYGEVPPYAVVVPGAKADPDTGLSLACAIIIKQVDARTREKTSVNELLRD